MLLFVRGFARSLRLVARRFLAGPRSGFLELGDTAASLNVEGLEKLAGFFEVPGPAARGLLVLLGNVEHGGLALNGGAEIEGAVKEAGI